MAEDKRDSTALNAEIKQHNAKIALYHANKADLNNMYAQLLRTPRFAGPKGKAELDALYKVKAQEIDKHVSLLHSSISNLENNVSRRMASERTSSERAKRDAARADPEKARKQSAAAMTSGGGVADIGDITAGLADGSVTYNEDDNTYTWHIPESHKKSSDVAKKDTELDTERKYQLKAKESELKTVLEQIGSAIPEDNHKFPLTAKQVLSAERGGGGIGDVETADPDSPLTIPGLKRGYDTSITVTPKHYDQVATLDREIESLRKPIMLAKDIPGVKGKFITIPASEVRAASRFAPEGTYFPDLPAQNREIMAGLGGELSTATANRLPDPSFLYKQLPLLQPTVLDQMVPNAPLAGEVRGLEYKSAPSVYPRQDIVAPKTSIPGLFDPNSLDPLHFLGAPDGTQLGSQRAEGIDPSLPLAAFPPFSRKPSVYSSASTVDTVPQKVGDVLSSIPASGKEGFLGDNPTRLSRTALERMTAGEPGVVAPTGEMNPRHPEDSVAFSEMINQVVQESDGRVPREKAKQFLSAAADLYKIKGKPLNLFTPRGDGKSYFSINNADADIQGLYRAMIPEDRDAAAAGIANFVGDLGSAMATGGRNYISAMGGGGMGGPQAGAPVLRAGPMKTKDEMNYAAALEDARKRLSMPDIPVGSVDLDPNIYNYVP